MTRRREPSRLRPWPRALPLGLAGTWALALLAACGDGDGGPGLLRGHQKISSSHGGFAGTLRPHDAFGRSVASLGDLDGDGVPDLAVGAFAGDGGPDRGAVWILYLNRDGTVRAHQKISSTEGGFSGALRDGDRFGIAVAPLGDLDGDGIPDLAVGAALDDDGGPDRGAVWILFLNRDGTVKAHQKISSVEGGFRGDLADGSAFGYSLAALGDLDGDGVADLAVGVREEEGPGAVWILFLNRDGTVRAHRKIGSGDGALAGALRRGDLFGSSLAPLGDLDGDGVVDLAVGAFRDVDGGYRRGAAWVLFLNRDGTVKAHQKISDTRGAFSGRLRDDEGFGSGVAPLGDLDGDGVPDLAVGARRDGDGGPKRGAVWTLLLNRDGTVNAHHKISDTRGGFSGRLRNDDQFGYSVASLGDLDGDGVVDLAAGAIFDDDGGKNAGAVWILFLRREAFRTGVTQRIRVDSSSRSPRRYSP